jgi:methylamine dehydrogenase accessory protein MauD
MSTPWIIAIVLQWALVLALAVVVVSLVRQLGIVAIRLNPSTGIDLGEGPGPGTELSAEPVTLLDGTEYQFAGSRTKPLVVVYLSPDCTICNRVSAGVRVVASSYAADIDLLLAVNATPKATRRYLAERELQDLPVALVQDMPRHLGINTTPFALGVSEQGTVATRGIPNATEHLEETIRATLEYEQRRDEETEDRRRAADAGPELEITQVAAT